MIALTLSWYEEKPEWLYEAVSSVVGVCEHVVAVDGAYALYPNARARSHPAQSEAVIFAAKEHGLGLTLHQPPAPWLGNEVEKRNRMYELAAHADWVLVLDGDEYVQEFPQDIHERLAATEKDAVVVAHDLGDRPVGWCKKLYRTPIRVGAFHAEYLNVRGENLHDDDTPAEWWQDMVLHHRKRERTPERKAAAEAYYLRRDEEGIEPR